MANNFDAQQGKTTVSTLFQSLNRNAPSTYDRGSSEEMFLSNLFKATGDFLVDSRLVNAKARNVIDDLSVVIGLEDFEAPTVASSSLNDVTLDTLLNAARIPESKRAEAVDSIHLLLAKFAFAGTSSINYVNTHFGSGRDNDLNTRVATQTRATYAPGVMGLINDNAVPAMEAFGASSDKVLPDIRSAIAVTLLRFHKGLLDRIMHRCVSDTPYVKYVQTYAEFYDMLKSNDADHKVRNDGSHRQPFINLYADAAPVSNELQPIIPLKANDTEDLLIADGVVAINKEANLFDLSRLAKEFGKTHTNWTDLVSEGAILDSVYVKFTKDGTSEIHQIATRDIRSAAFNMYPNAADSSDRSATVEVRVVLNKDSKDSTGNATKLFTAFTGNDFLRVGVHVHADIRNKTSDVLGYGAVNFAPFNSANVPVQSAAKTAITGLTAELIGYTVDARYSEENLRRSNLAIQTNVKTYDYEISNGRYILVDYSLQEDAPDAVMKFVSEASSLGCDHRAVDIITHQLMYVYDRNHEEATVPGLQSRLTTLGLNYVAGMRVRPTVYLATIDLNKVDTIRSGDILGDIRQTVEWELLNLISLLHQNSYYKHQLEDGETPKYKVCTSNVIIDNLLGIPHYHNHLNKNDTPTDNSGNVEFRHVLPNGTELDCVSTTFNDMRDKMFIIPFRESDPKSELNFGHNWDFGTFVGSYEYQFENAVNKRFIANTRSQVVPTNPCGLYINVKGLDGIVNMFAKGTPTKSRLPNPGDLVVPLV